jgi:hypothetical protein
MIFLNKSLQITVNLSAINSDFQYYSFVAGILQPFMLLISKL